ncbi:uncharacterized protein TNCV_2254741 [Trichonephila clavipes]|nr:uncharacterized protein TNCV_2254741 [Trichonephila clavipes]
MKTRYDTKATGHQFKEGDKVWFYNPTRRKGLSPKLQSHWDGPYTILKIINDVVIRIPTRGLLATGHVILNHGQVTWTIPELAPPLLTTTPHQREDVSALDRFNVHRCPTRRVFSGTGIELVTKQATIRYLYHSATAAQEDCGSPEVKKIYFSNEMHRPRFRVIKNLCAVMSLPNPVEQKSHDVINNKLSRVMKEVAEESMKMAAVEEYSSSPDNL